MASRVAQWAFAAVYLVIALIAVWGGVMALNPPLPEPTPFNPEPLPLLPLLLSRRHLRLLLQLLRRLLLKLRPILTLIYSRSRRRSLVRSIDRRDLIRLLMLAREAMFPPIRRFVSLKR